MSPRCLLCLDAGRVVTNGPTDWWFEGQLWAPCPECSGRCVDCGEPAEPELPARDPRCPACTQAATADADPEPWGGSWCDQL